MNTITKDCEFCGLPELALANVAGREVCADCMELAVIAWEVED